MDISISLNEKELNLLYDSIEFLFFIGGNRDFIAENREDLEKLKDNLRVLKNIRS